MAIRKCAREDPAFSRLLQVYEHREQTAQAWRSAGKKVVAKLGFDVPDEMVIAAGMLPVQVYADPDQSLEKTDTYLEFAFDPLVRHQFEKIVDGTYQTQADFLAISNSTDVVIRVFLYLREMRRQGLEQIPPVTFLDWLFTRHRLYQQRNELTVQMFWQQLEQWSGQPITEAALREAMHLCNENRQALRTMQALRRGETVRITGCEALVIIGAGFFMEKQEHTALVRQVTAAAQQWDPVSGVRVFLTGSAQEDTQLYQMIEELGAVVVGEDHDWGDRSFDRDCNPDYPVVRSLVDRYMLREFSAKKAFVSQRVDALLRQVADSNAQAVLFYNHIYEEAASWDYPSQAAALRNAGIPSASFAKMYYPVTANPELPDALKKFLQGEAICHG
ncbi:MAG: 2-hydroxyacyl-CoA dehydratase family protein [Firmicutes bacterium]|nr:2-hydroxyacyl-CoA dehydratase family protein [Bacillota bacterium]